MQGYIPTRHEDSKGFQPLMPWPAFGERGASSAKLLLSHEAKYEKSAWGVPRPCISGARISLQQESPSTMRSPTFLWILHELQGSRNDDSDHVSVSAGAPTNFVRWLS